MTQNGLACNFADESLRPFLASYAKCLDEIKSLKMPQNTTNPETITHAESLIAAIKDSFIKDTLNLSELTHVLNKTHAFISNPKAKPAKDYQAFIQKALSSPLSGMQLLGKLMMALSVALVGAAIGMGVTGVGIIPAVGVGVLAVGLFSAGTYLVRKGRQKDAEHISHFSTPPV